MVLRNTSVPGTRLRLESCIKRIRVHVYTQKLLYFWKSRKHVDWELYSSMFDGTKNKRSGILVINLPSTRCTYFSAAHGDEEKRIIYPEQRSWTHIDSRTEYETRYPYVPDRIIDNLLSPKAYISVVPWERLTADNLEFLIDVTFLCRGSCEYDMRRRMRRRNSSPA